MTRPVILASGSETRQRLLRNAGVPIIARPVRIDEAAIRDSMLADRSRPRDIAASLADFKARRASQTHPEDVIIGCDQVLALGGHLLAKPTDAQHARAQLDQMNGKSHRLLSAAVIYERGNPVWRHVGIVDLHMRTSTQAYLDDYVARNWPGIQDSVGGYKLEEEGIRLFHRIDGDFFNVLGLPLLEILNYLTLKGLIPG